jgi:GTP-binding protein Era
VAPSDAPAWEINPINALLGQSIAPLAAAADHPPAPAGDLTQPEYQVIFVDTPGTTGRDRSGKLMLDDTAGASTMPMRSSSSSISPRPTRDDRRKPSVLKSPPPVVIALNKVDEVPADRLSDRRAAFLALLPDCEGHSVSALRGDGRLELLERLVGLLPPGPRYYPADQVTDLHEREIAGELVRAAAMRLLREEVPYGITTRVDDYRERGQEGAYIGVTLYVERESHKPIVIGKSGAMLRRIGTEARREIEAMSGRGLSGSSSESAGGLAR